MTEIKLFVAFCFVLSAGVTVSAVTTGSIYSIESLASDANRALSLTVRNDGSVTVEFARIDNPLQRYVTRITKETVFNLFLEVQPWNWVDYIVERSKTVNINNKTPQAIDTAIQNGVRVLVQKNYDGSDGQQWYLVPSGSVENVGLITHLLSRRCIQNNGFGQLVTADICDPNNPNQLWRLAPRDTGRCF